jgi:hypothetical protein
VTRLAIVTLAVPLVALALGCGNANTGVATTTDGGSGSQAASGVAASTGTTTSGVSGSASGGAGGSSGSGGSAGSLGINPGNTTLTNTNPPLDGTKVSCSCIMDFSPAGQDAGVPAQIGPVVVEACVPVNLADAGAYLESDTCQQLAQPFLKVLTAQVALSAKPPINSAVVCGWAVGFDPDAAVLPPLVTVTCAAQPFSNVAGHPLRVSSPSCQDPMGRGCHPPWTHPGSV